ncbi:MAG: serine/threonine protein kinase [Deltaproteobacteria bacterium]|nr:serine/threonine protein kinase [Deltaproteobacteria bacterium]
MEGIFPIIPGLRVVRRIAVGGMAELFLCESLDSPPRLLVAKRLLPGLDAAAAALFAREREVLARVSSPHVVRLLGGGPDCLLLEYVDGPDLATLLVHRARRGQPLPLGAGLAAVEGVALGLAAIHEARGADGAPLRAVHRDVNPSNVLVSRAGEVKVADLGVVRVGAADAPSLAGLKGTLAYMAPEQLSGGPVDDRTDLFAAGLVAYEVLTGVPARPAGMVGVAELIRARAVLPAPPSAVRPDLPAALDAAVLAALEPDPARRPGGCRDWLALVVGSAGAAPDPAALAAAAAGATTGPVRAGRTLAPASQPVVARPRRRGRAGWWSAAAVAAIAVAAIAVAAGVRWVSPDPPAASVDPVPVPVPVPEPVPEPEPVPAFDPPSHPDPRPHSAPAPAARRAAEGPAAPGTTRLPKPGPTAVRLRVGPAGGTPVHVSGTGWRFLAPGRSEPLGDGAHVVSLRGGPDGLPASVRVVRSGDRLTASIGAPEGRYYSAKCGGRDLGTTPVLGLPLDREVACTLEDASGASFGFTLFVERE